MEKEQYINRLDRVCALLHSKICKEIGAKLGDEHCYDRVPKLVERSHEGKVITLWNLQVQTDRTIPNYKPDSIIREDRRG